MKKEYWVLFNYFHKITLSWVCKISLCQSSHFSISHFSAKFLRNNK